MHGLSFQARRQTDTLSHAKIEKPRREQNRPPRRNENLFRPGPKNTHENRNERQTRGLENATFAERLPERTEEEAEAAKKVHEPTSSKNRAKEKWLSFFAAALRIELKIGPISFSLKMKGSPQAKTVFRIAQNGL